MCVAADYGQTDVICYLIDNGADVNVSVSFEYCSLHYQYTAGECCLFVKS